MSNVIVAFPKRENAVNIRNILTRSGVEVSAVCMTGAKVLQHAELWNDGIIICGMRFQDMHYMQLRELLSDGYEIILLGPPGDWIGELPEGVVGLPSPLKVHDLLDTLDMISSSQERRRKKRRETARKRNSGEQKAIGQAKALLMERNGMSEEEAHRYLQKTSMASGTNMTETAQMILRMMEGNSSAI